jgi:hypothetical protein
VILLRMRSEEAPMLLRRALLKPPLDLLDLWPPLYLRRYPKCMDSREVDSREVVAASGVHRARFSCSTTREGLFHAAVHGVFRRWM